MKEEHVDSHPFFGRQRVLLERIHSLDSKWYVEFWEEHYFFLGIEIFFRKKEVVKKNGKNSSTTNL